LKFRLFSFAPELQSNGTNLVSLMSNNFHNLNPKGWKTYWIDLRPNMEVLRANLHGNWRNKLVISEKNNIQFEIGSDSIFFDWMLDKYKENMNLKNFEGISISLLKEMFKNSTVDNMVLIFRSHVNSIYIGGICLVLHGCSATYLLGWTDPQGRSLKANHLLLWKVVEYLRDNGIIWFDLGGIDEESTPGVTEFKTGIGGELNELVGEYFKI
jgi:hypothetical protein